MAHSKSSKLSFIVYGPGSAPRYFEIKKNLFRFLVFGLPGLALICALSTALLGTYFRYIQHSSPEQTPKEALQFQREKGQFLEKIQVLEREKSELALKLRSAPSASQLNSLQFFAPSLGRKDLTAEMKTQLAIEDMALNLAGQKLEMNFKIVNLTQGQKRISGYLFILLQSEGQIHTWPAQALNQQNMQMEFSSGEFFATRRFRPVTATFNAFGNRQVVLKALIFNQTGDLIFENMSNHQLPQE